MSKKALTSLDIDLRLQNRTVKRIGEYINCISKLEFQCLICDFTWLSTTTSVIANKNNCPKCSDRLKLNNNIIDEKLKKNNSTIIRVGDHIKYGNKITFKCIADNCNYIWSALPSGVINGNNGCPSCSYNFLNNDQVDKILINKNIIRVDDYVNSRIPIHFKCKICNDVWIGRPDGLLYGKQGCSKCAGNKKITNEIIDQYFIDHNIDIKRIDNYINNITPIAFECLNCNHIWPTAPSSILIHKSGCPICNKCFKNQKYIFKTLKKNNIIFDSEYLINKINTNITNRYRVDFYISSRSTIIEYNGEQHYKPIRFGNMNDEQMLINFNKQQLRDKYIEQFCNDNNIKLIWIDGRKYKNNKLIELITNEIIPLLK